jgi:putative heme-binding domain-containing protein
MPSRLLAALSLLLLPLPAAAQAPAVRVPPGFEVTEFAGADLANDIYCLTVDPQGRVLVSGRGYVRLLLDETGKGRATKAVDFAGAPKDGAMGLCWDGSDLFCMGDGGLRVWRDADGKGRGQPPELVFPLKTGGEHDAHAVRRGPDGWLYLLCGNSTGVAAKHATLPTSPVKEPVAGAVLRLSPDLKGCEIVADGFRNPYGFDFNADGELFTFDSDNERCVALPWYEGCRLYHVVDGGNHGWLAPQQGTTWRKPPYFADVVPPILDLGRGSPTGVVCYRHVQFPEKYRGGLFLCDWTFGRVYFVKLEKSGASYAGKAEVFLQATGDTGLAPTAAALDPKTGDVYFSIGGRGTRGAVYRVRHTEGFASLKPDEAAKWQPTPRSLEWQEGCKAGRLKMASDGKDAVERRRALEYVRRHREHFTAEEVEAAIRANWGASDRLLRQAVARLLDDLPEREDRQRFVRAARTPTERLTVGLAGEGGRPMDLVTDPRLPAEVRLEAVRRLQCYWWQGKAKSLAGTVWEGYAVGDFKRVTLFPEDLESLPWGFPSGNADLDRELSRVLAMIGADDPKTLRKVADKLTPDSSPIEDVHYLIVLARLRAPRPKEVTERTAAALLALDAKLTKTKQNRDTNWPLRMAEVHAELAKKDPALNAALLASADFGRPDHALFTRAPGFDRAAAAERFLARSKADPEYAWNAEVVGLLGALPPEKALPVLRGLWGEHGLEEAILPLLARSPKEEDRARLRQGLGSAQPATVKLCVEALDKLPGKANADETLDLLLALRRLPPDKEQAPLRDRLVARLQSATGQKLTDADAWRDWYVKEHPDKAAKLADPDGVDVAAWDKRLSGIDWDRGDAERGRAVFTKASCAACHSGSQAMGPDLHGVTGRFSRADLLTAILRPGKDVSPRYRATLFTTTTGKVYQGLIVYEATDGVLLQTGPGETVRIDGPLIASRRLTANSPMPAGLLDRLSDGEIADLYAHLKSLGGK